MDLYFWYIYYEKIYIINPLIVSPLSKTIAYTAKYKHLLLKCTIFKGRVFPLGMSEKNKIECVVVMSYQKYLVVVIVSYNTDYKH